MEKIKNIGLVGCMMALALLLGGCSAHAGFSVGKSATPTTVTVAQSQMSEAPK